MPWTSGVVEGADIPELGSMNAEGDEVVDDGKGPRLYHTVTSAQGSAVHWMARVHYYW